VRRKKAEAQGLIKPDEWCGVRAGHDPADHPRPGLCFSDPTGACRQPSSRRRPAVGSMRPSSTADVVEVGGLCAARSRSPCRLERRGHPEIRAHPPAHRARLEDHRPSRFINTRLARRQIANDVASSRADGRRCELDPKKPRAVRPAPIDSTGSNNWADTSSPFAYATG